MEHAHARSAIGTQLVKPWVLPARIIWLAATLISLGLFIAGLPQRANEINALYRGDIQVGLTQNQKGEIILSTWSSFSSTAARAGVLNGDILLAVDDVPVTSVKQAEALIQGAIGTTVTISVRTGRFPARQLAITRDSEAGSVLLEYGLSSGFAVSFVLAGEILFAALCLGIAAVIFWQRSDDWMALLSALLITMTLVGLSLPVIAFGESIRTAQFPYWLDVWYVLAFGSLIIYFYIFPSGGFASRLTRGLAAALGLWLMLGLFNRSWLLWYQPTRIYTFAGIGWTATGVLALIHRFRQSDALQREKIGWIVWGASASALGLLLQIIPPLFDLNPSRRVVYDFLLYPLGQLFKAGLPVSIALAILRHHLWNIELVINRVLVYGSLSVLTMLGYLGAVFVMQALFTGLANPAISFFATGFIAVLFEPLRQRLQRGINRWMYGERDDPYAVLTQLASSLERTSAADEVLPRIARTIGHALKIPYVAIALDQDGREQMAAAFGTQTNDLLSFPLVYQGETIGRLQIARRAPGEEFSDADRHLIESIAQQAGAAVQTVRLHTELIHSRAQIVNEREDERLRIRRDLHDELGPVLASQGLKLAAVRQTLRNQPEKAEQLIDEISEQSQQTVADIRRLVHGLRPPVLDQLGLVEAVRDLVRDAPGKMTVEISSLENPLPKLPAAMEVNAYRIILEALSNSAKHANAGQCLIQFEVEPGAFVIRIQDDGTGMPGEYRAGVGLRSMRSRAEEIGGELRVEPVQPHGTQITARLPFSF